MVANTVPVAVVPRTVRQEPVFLACRMIQSSGALRSLTIPLVLASLASSQFFFLSRLYYLIARRRSSVENSLAPVTAPISLLIARSKLGYFLITLFIKYIPPVRYLSTLIVFKMYRFLQSFVLYRTLYNMYLFI